MNLNKNYPYKIQKIPFNKTPITKKTPRNKNLKKLKVLSYYSNGLHNKIPELKTSVTHEEPDIIALCKIKSNEVTINLLFEINGYYPYYRLRNENGGGVALLIKDKLISEEVQIPIIYKDEDLKIKKTLFYWGI